MRLPLVLLAVSLLGVVGGAWLVGRWAVGCAVIFDSLCVGWWALGRDDGAVPAPRALSGGVSLGEALERARQAP